MSQFSERIHELFATPLTENVTLFSVMLAIILIMPIITKKLRLPQVIGLILCGVIVGPHALNIVDNSGAIGLFSTIGLLYIMFMAGLELDMNQFKVNRNRSFLFGFLTYLGPLLVIFPICYWGYNLGLLESFLVGSMFG
ncbi:MAG: cation:proton antiporter, partial [Proteobacteria bacterium]|nr:cation:proton antiporter [Pseudomonadota bacterium]